MSFWIAVGVWAVGAAAPWIAVYRLWRRVRAAREAIRQVHFSLAAVDHALARFTREADAPLRAANHLKIAHQWLREAEGALAGRRRPAKDRPFRGPR